MRTDDLATVLSYSKQEKKPIMIYINSPGCVSSREFTRIVMGTDTVKKYLKKHFNCINANTQTAQGDAIAKKFGIMIVPAVILIGIDQDVYIKPEMEVHAEGSIREFNRFLSSVELMEMIRLYSKSHHISIQNARHEIGKSLAQLDFKRNKNGNPFENLRRYNLDIGMLSVLAETYKKEWEKLKGE